MSFNETEILEQFDLAYKNTLNKYFPKGRPQDIRYNHFPDLENGYCIVASSRIHLYVDASRWAIVFETAGYETRQSVAAITLYYFGNCVDFPVNESEERNYITNLAQVILIDQEEFERIENIDGGEMETFELIGEDIREIKVRDIFIPFENNHEYYEKVGIHVRDYDNPKKLIAFEDLIRFWHETNPQLISATENEIKIHIPSDLPKHMTIEDFHYISAFEKTILPSQQELYKLLAKVLVSQDNSNWKPTLPPNNSWKNWASGDL